MVDEIRVLVKRIDAGKPQVGDVEALRAALAANKTGLPAPLSGQDIAEQIVKAVAPKPAARIALLVEYERVREGLGYSRSEGVERALVDHVATCWLRLQVAESALTQKIYGPHNPDTGRYLEARLTEAQTRYLRAVALLERLRRYVPNVQINIVNQHVVRGP